MPFQLPPQLQSKLDEYLPQAREHAEQLKQLLGPAGKLLLDALNRFKDRLTVAGTDSVGSTFRHVCVVGLNRSEMLLGGESQSVFADNWQDLADESLRRQLALIFFAPRGLDGHPVNPYLFLMGEPTDKPVEEGAADGSVLAQQAIGNMPLLDYCRLPPAEPNTVNILVAADVMFHWDIKDNYILPTTPTSWVRDVEQVIKTYPRTTRANIYTQWDTDILPVNERTRLFKLRDLPLEPSTWLNQPTMQEKYGTLVLVSALVLAGLTYGAILLQQRSLSKISEQLYIVQQQIPRGGEFSDLERAITEQEKMFNRRELFALVVRDAARAIQRAGMQVDSFEVRVPDPNEPPKQYLVTIDAMEHAYQGWLQEEPIARGVMLASALMDGIRKPPTTGGFKLEGLVDAVALHKKYRQAQALRPRKGVSPTLQMPQQEGEGK